MRASAARIASFSRSSRRPSARAASRATLSKARRFCSSIAALYLHPRREVSPVVCLLPTSSSPASLTRVELVLVHPEIPHNSGCAARLAAALGLRLHLVEPLGFSLADRYLK